MSESVLVLRLAGPMQSWGVSSKFNVRETEGQPTKSGVIGLLAAAQGRRRSDDIEDLLQLRLGVRVDQPGRLQRDYHTVSDYRGVPLPSSGTNAKGQQRSTSPKKYTHVTKRYYLADAVFVAALEGSEDLLATLAAAVRRPAFPLALGRRSCVPAQPLVVPDADQILWPGGLDTVLAQVPWQASAWRVRRATGPTVTLPVVTDDPAGSELAGDVPTSFEPGSRVMRSRPVRSAWVEVPTGVPADGARGHDPFELLGG
ncbi:type I-E CRISPR-associated protein Cas5/CasD [Phycicoccus sp. CSK15P-2]|uniref:type I-E CRISPR-associated protein Cas5/CasD n=1 Tax=Phycicoccus sp. CSK15P-2 TaxID=2807627 RepID=UPI00194F7C0F|nr:type I-E CRISPR-associated protein Cas5/CasD [Phycicoccus sp. CSK15P-2]MBM6404832.1 type I-E CRISPR-associated protein Cas5/CasD [Phycicoccus sp. CSK15P-2]